MAQEFVVREARASDKEVVLRFCQNTFEWGDYIERVWDFWITDPKGKILVAVFNGIPVGMSHVTILKKGEAWLEGARIAPEFRRMGVASLLTEDCLEFAVDKGAKRARLATDSNNFAAHELLAKLGFRRVSDWALMEFAGCQLEAYRNVRFAEKSDVDGVWGFLVNLECYAKSAGLYTILFRWMSLDRRELQKFIRRRKAIVHEQGGKVDGLLLFDDTIKVAWRENIVQTCYVDGDFAAVLSMGRFLKSRLYDAGVAGIYGVLCNFAPLTSAFSELGFKADARTELVYEKKL